MGPSVPEITAALRPLYGDKIQRRDLNALDELIFTVLTQHTSDLNAERAYATLRAAIPNWEGVLEADTARIEELIRHCGLAAVRSVRIKRILELVQERHGKLELDWLADLGLEGARAWLLELPGVGIKTASVVASFALNLPALPVDTHIHRVSKRLGLIGGKVSAEAAHSVLEALVEEELRFEFHMLLINHGRALCAARRPRCESCPLRRACPSSTASR